MNETTEMTLVNIPRRLVAEIDDIWSDGDLESFVCQAVQSYVDAFRRRQLDVQLAKDYDELAILYSELSDELSDEVWLPRENEALLAIERVEIN